MEGTVSEEPKSVHRGADASQGGSELLRVKKKLASRVQRGTYASQEGSELGNIKRKRVKKERVPWVQRGADTTQGGSERLRVKRKRVKKKLDSRLPRGIDASQGSSECRQVKRKRVKKENFSWLKRGTDAPQGGSNSKRVVEDSVSWLQRITDAGGYERFRPRPIRSRFIRKDESSDPIFEEFFKNLELQHAKEALELYRKSQGGEFEVLEVIYSHGTSVVLPESEDSQLWYHISFIAKPKNADCSDVSSKHFFAEYEDVEESGTYIVKYCSTFEPSDDPGFNHGCVFCPKDVEYMKFHPAINGYHVGCPPWSVEEVVYL
ncbi:uncharacterized protein [Euphorbia lathyris]|uniref:uncharacterized protein n=1 Tax=Euphorbia lathyris TaxID=212925 RepID=UPI0033139C36